MAVYIKCHLWSSGSLIHYWNRLYCSNLHYNENSNRKQATTSEGKLRWVVAYPKAFKGEKAVAKPLKEKPTYGKNIVFCTRHYQIIVPPLYLI